MFFSDRLTLDKARRTDDGYMAIHAKAARSGIYQYLGREIDPDGKHFAADQVVNVYRPPDEVFDKASLGSFVGKPITDDHPAEGVDSTNWRDLARGTIMGAAKDGEYVGFDLAFMDADLIAAVDAGKKELSNGYAAKIEIGDGVAPDGTKYQATQTTIRGNHVAVVKAGRAGSSCCIGDAATCGPIASDEVKKLLIDERTYDAARNAVTKDKIEDNPFGGLPVPKLILIDGHQIDISNVDVAEATIRTLEGKITAANDRAETAEAEVATLTTDKANLEAENETLKAQAEDNKITPAMLRDAAKSYAATVDAAKALGATVADDMDEAAIKRACVDAKLGDKAKEWTDAQIDASFAALSKDAKPQERDALGDAMRSGIRPISDGAASIEDARRAALSRKETAYLN